MSVSGGQIHILMSFDMLFRWFRFLWQHFMSYIISPVKNNFIISFFFSQKKPQNAPFPGHTHEKKNKYFPLSPPAKKVWI